MPGMKGVELLEEVHRRSPADGEDPAHRAGRPGRRGLRDQPRRASTSTSPSRGTSPTCGSPSRTCCPAFRLERERAELLSELRTAERRARVAEFVARGEGRRADPRAGDAERAPRRAGHHRRAHRPLQPPVFPRAAVAGDGAQQPDRLAAVGPDDRRRSLQGLQRPSRPPGRRQRPARRLAILAARPARQRRGGALRRRGVRHHPARRRARRRPRRSRSGSAPRLPSFRSSSAARSRAGKLTISLGVAAFPDDGAEPAVVLASADRALFAAKNAGRNCVRVSGQ